MGSGTDITKLASFLQVSRTKSGLSQKEVAKKMGYRTSQFVSNWERGVSQPPIPVLKTLAQLYKVPAEEMFKLLLEVTVKQVEKDLKQKFYSA